MYHTNEEIIRNHFKLKWVSKEEINKINIKHFESIFKLEERYPWLVLTPELLWTDYAWFEIKFSLVDKSWLYDFVSFTKDPNY